ncbi:MAG TPA: hypothetical protein PLM09_11595, partial [Casimicrobiaceae bacterium]|nr:hypothetical protein [Casimicrobiaceae bacterium]
QVEEFGVATGGGVWVAARDFDPELRAHRVERTGLQLILEIPNNGEGSAKVQRLMTSLTTSCVQKNWNISHPPERPDLPNELVATHCALSDENVRM